MTFIEFMANRGYELYWASAAETDSHCRKCDLNEDPGMPLCGSEGIRLVQEYLKTHKNHGHPCAALLHIEPEKFICWVPSKTHLLPEE